MRLIAAERKTSLGKDWHSACLRCEKCNRTLVPGGHAEHEGKPYCDKPCYSSLFGPKGKKRKDEQRKEKLSTFNIEKLGIYVGIRLSIRIERNILLIM